MSMFYVGQCWATRLVRTCLPSLSVSTRFLTGVDSRSADTPGHTTLNLVFFISFTTCVWNFYRAITLDPGFVPRPSGDAEVKEVRPNVRVAATSLVCLTSCSVRFFYRRSRT